MDRKKMVEATVFTTSYPDILKRTNKISLILSLGILLIGGTVLFSSFLLNEKSSATSMLLIIIGTALLLIGVFRLFWRTKEMLYAPTLSPIHESSLFYDSTLSDRIVELLHSADFTVDKVIKSSEKGTVRLDVLMSGDAKFVALQLFEYIPYTYSPVSPVFHFADHEARGIVDYLKKSNAN